MIFIMFTLYFRGDRVLHKWGSLIQILSLALMQKGCAVSIFSKMLVICYPPLPKTTKTRLVLQMCVYLMVLLTLETILVSFVVFLSCHQILPNHPMHLRTSL